MFIYFNIKTSMTKPSCFCTLATKTAAFELVGFLLSLSIYHTDETVHIVADTETKNEIQHMTPQPKLNIIWHIDLDKYSNFTRRQMEQLNIWSEFQMYKTSALEYSLQSNPNSLFLDCDILITAPIDCIDLSKPLGVSPHYMNKTITDKYGYYNGGMLWVSDINIVKDWRMYTKTSRFYDQASIEDLANKYSHFCFGSNYNVQGWRFHNHQYGQDGFKNAISIINNTVCYDKQPIKCIHTHFRENTFHQFNSILINHFNHLNMYPILAIIYRILYGKWQVRIPKQPMKGMGAHKNDSYRELPILWKANNKDVNVVYDDKTIHCWIEPTILCYDRPTLQWTTPELSISSLLLLGNGDVKQEGKEIQEKFPNIIVKPWIFWPRKPMLVEKILKTYDRLQYHQRQIISIFIGNVENSVQMQFRDPELWKNKIEFFHLTKGQTYKYTHEEYLMNIRNAKFGLCLRGYGSKCHREIELMAFGTVPIVTENICTDSFWEPLVENVHFISATPETINSVLQSVTVEKWDFMSHNCRKWYDENVHSSRSWNTMINRILFE